MPTPQETKLRELITEMNQGWGALREEEKEARRRLVNLGVDRPADYHHLDEGEQWAIDKRLGLLDA